MSSRTRRFAYIVGMLPAVYPTPSIAQAWVPRVEVAAGGGFVGTPSTEIVQRPALNCTAANECTPVDGQVDLFADSRRVWRPALATGLVLRWRLKYIQEDSTPDERFGIGLGGQMVFTPQPDGTRLLPAATFHAGTKSTQLFFGLLFGSFDSVEFPNGVSTVRVSTGSQPNFVRPGGDDGPGFFVGVVIEGVAVTK